MSDSQKNIPSVAAEQEGFSRELQRLERFARAACAKDRRYQEVLPVIVPAGGEECLIKLRNHLRHITPWVTKFGMRLNAAVDEFAKAAHWQQALHLWSTAALSDRNEVTYNSLIAACHRGSQWQRALIVLKELEQKLQATVISYSSALSAVAKADDRWHLALHLFQAMENVQRDAIVYNATIAACGEKWQHALSLFFQLVTSRLQGSLVSYNSAISAAEKSGEWRIAMQLMEDLIATPHLLPDIITYNAVISACAKGGQWQHAMSLYSALLGYRLYPSVITCSSLISACERGGRWQEALHLLEELPAYEVKANIITYNSAISACEKRGQWQNAQFLMVQLKVCGLFADVITFNSTISACEKGGHWLQASHLLSMLQTGHQATVISFNSTISAHEECSQWPHALQTLQELGHLIPSSATEMTCNSVISACDKGSRWSQAFWFLDDLHRQSHRHDVMLFTCNLAACASAAQWRRGLIVSAMSMTAWTGGLGGLALGILQSLAVTACVQQRHWREALGLHGKGSPADVLTVNLTMDACEHFNYWLQSLQLLTDLENDHDGPNAVSYSFLE
eukprot:symbB.v1.2.017711.t1/scaffold1384.1/size122353/1